MEATTIQTASKTYTLQIPESDRSFFNSLVKKMGWTAKCIKARKGIPTETLRAVKEARAGKDAGTVDTSSLEAFINSMD